MTTLKATIFLPVYILLHLLCKEREAFDADAANWCRWKHLEYSNMAVCRLFISDKAFRNLFYYRLGQVHALISWLFPSYDHLQITTPRGHIAGGMIFQHGFSTIVSAKSIGRNCKIYQQVTIGYNHRLEAPVIGDNVEICCGAKIIGGVHIGNNVLIGANAVVVKDIPDNSVVAGIPARIIKRTISNNTK